MLVDATDEIGCNPEVERSVALRREQVDGGQESRFILFALAGFPPSRE